MVESYIYIDGCGLEIELGSQMANEHSGFSIRAGWPSASCLTFSEARFPHRQDINSIFPTLEGC